MRMIKFRAWDKRNEKWLAGNEIELRIGLINYSTDKPNEFWLEDKGKNAIGIDVILLQFTGLLDKNGLTEVYEGDIIDENGIVKGNVYESPQIFEAGIDFVVEGMGTKTWRSSESIAMGRGCKYSK